jgi:hypothetical protein
MKILVSALCCALAHAYTLVFALLARAVCSSSIGVLSESDRNEGNVVMTAAFEGAPEEVDVTVFETGNPEADAISEAASQLVAKVSRLPHMHTRLQ